LSFKFSKTEPTKQNTSYEADIVSPIHEIPNLLVLPQNSKMDPIWNHKNAVHTSNPYL